MEIVYDESLEKLLLRLGETEKGTVFVDDMGDLYGLSHDARYPQFFQFSVMFRLSSQLRFQSVAIPLCWVMPDRDGTTILSSPFTNGGAAVRDSCHLALIQYSLLLCVTKEFELFMDLVVEDLDKAAIAEALDQIGQAESCRDWLSKPKPNTGKIAIVIKDANLIYPAAIQVIKNTPTSRPRKPAKEWSPADRIISLQELEEKVTDQLLSALQTATCMRVPCWKFSGLAIKVATDSQKRRRWNPGTIWALQLNHSTSRKARPMIFMRLDARPIRLVKIDMRES
jgi:hypothetical protein